MPLTFSPYRVFSGQAGNGPRRLAVMGTAATLILGAVGGFALIGNPAPPINKAAKVPNADPLPGGAYGSPYFHELAREQAKEQGREAEKAGRSYVAPLEGNAPPEPAPRTVTADPVIPSPVPHARPNPPPAATTQANPFTPSAPNAPAASVQRVSDSAQSPKVDERQVAAYDAAMKELFGRLNGKAAETQHWDKKEDTAARGGQPERGGPPENGPDGLARVRNVSSAGTSSNAASLGTRRTGRVLMPADRGVYAVNKLAVSSDGGGPVVVEAQSGPIAGDRMRGGFEQKGDRLVVSLTSLTHNGRDIPIQAIVVTPDTMETTVASRVEQHYLERFALPAAAAFVAGLGQALAQSNTTSVISPFGGATGFSRLNLGQQFGVAAGASGAQIGQTLQQSAPKKATVYLDANTPVGVVFLSTVEEPD